MLKVQPRFSIWTAVKQTARTLTFILKPANMDLFCGECRARSDCTYVQSYLDLHSPQPYPEILSTKAYPMTFNELKSVFVIVYKLNSGG